MSSEDEEVLHSAHRPLRMQQPLRGRILARHGATRHGSGSGAGGRVTRHGPGVLARDRRATRHATGAAPPVGV